MKSKKKLKVLITGGSGMIGSNLVKRLIKLNYEIYVVDNLWRGKKQYLFSEKKKRLSQIKISTN